MVGITKWQVLKGKLCICSANSFATYLIEEEVFVTYVQKIL